MGALKIWCWASTYARRDRSSVTRHHPGTVQNVPITHPILKNYTLSASPTVILCSKVIIFWPGLTSSVSIVVSSSLYKASAIVCDVVAFSLSQIGFDVSLNFDKEAAVWHMPGIASPAPQGAILPTWTPPRTSRHFRPPSIDGKFACNSLTAKFCTLIQVFSVASWS